MSGLRVIVGEADGTRSTLWRIVTGRRTSDVYIGARPVMGEVKVSLHERGPWRYGFTTEHELGPNPLVAPGEDRAKFKWQRPPEFVPGLTRAFAIMVPSTELRPLPRREPLRKPAVWVASPPDGCMVEIAVFLHRRPRAPGTWPGQRSMGTKLLYEQELLNGEDLLVVSVVREVKEEVRRRLEMYKAAISDARRQAIAAEAPTGSDLRGFLLASPEKDPLPDQVGVWMLYDIQFPAP